MNATAVAAAAILAGIAAPSPLAVQSPPDDRALAAIASWTAVDAATGYERRIAPALASALGWTADDHGNIVTSIGSGTPHRIVACALDRPSYAVTQIRDDGYLRVHRIGGGSRHPLWDQQFEAQQVRVMTQAGAVAGVAARANGHFGQQHRHETRVITADDLWIDVGAESDAEVEALGIRLLDPVSRELPPWPMAGAVAGPDAGRRGGCAAAVALAATARARGVQGRVTFVLSAQEVMGWIGLSSLIARGDAVDQLIVLAPGAATRADSERPVAQLQTFGTVAGEAGLKTVRWLAPAVEQAGSHMEILRGAEAQWLLETAAVAAGVAAPSGDAWVAAPPRQPLVRRHADVAHAELATQLTALVELPGVSGHEAAVRRAVLESLPAWARPRAIVDEAGNVRVEVGPSTGQAVVFMAHMDEVGYTIESIAADGTVTPDAQGGALASAWEGQTALLHFERSDAGARIAPLRGVFRIRAAADSRHPSGAMQAWFGLNARELAARGVKPGLQVTSFKQGQRIGAHRFTGRGLDDRAGTLALLRALARIDPASIRVRTIFAWSVEEETGLVGAEALAARLGRETARVYSVDTFVSSDTPLESPHFAHTPLGAGPVFRAIESSGVSRDDERTRVERVAGAAGIPLQFGLTQGGTDGTTFTFRGAPNQGLSWPGRYSHSPGELLDLRDLDALSRLIVAVATSDSSSR